MDSNHANFLDVGHRYMTDVKLVVGNGFDLACGLDSTYASFFASADFGQPIVEACLAFEADPSIALPESVSLWDLLFHLVSKRKDSPLGEDAKWKDVEAVMRVALGFKTKGYPQIPFSFDKVHDHYSYGEKGCSPEEKILLSAVKERNFPKEERGFYQSLLAELRIFEKRFAAYIRSRMTPEYEEKARRMFTEEHKLKFQHGQLRSIDSFNYTTPKVFSDETLFGRPVSVRHVNGSIDGAIFGIDSKGVPLEDERFRFTKTYRKITRLAHGGREEHSRTFQNVVVYGHSLAEADYSYFFPILKKMNLTEYDNRSSRFVIAYSDYDPKIDVGEKNAWAALRMFSAYSDLHHEAAYIDTLESNDRFGFAKVEMP